MPIESVNASPVSNISDLLPVGSANPTSKPASSPFNDPRSSIDYSGTPPQAKSVLTRIYEGFCYLLSLIKDFFYPPQEQTPNSLENSAGSLRGLGGSSSEEETPPSSSPLEDEGRIDLTRLSAINLSALERQFPTGNEDSRSSEAPPLKEHQFALAGSSDEGSRGSGDSPAVRRQSTVSTDASSIVIVEPSEGDSIHSKLSSKASGSLSLGSSDPFTASSNRQSSDGSVIENALYVLAQGEEATALKKASISGFEGVIPRSLEISVQNQKDIKEVLTTIGDNTFVGLTPSVLRLQELGATIDRDVHPYRFLIEILKDTDCKASLKGLLTRKGELFTGRNVMWNRFVSKLGLNFETRKADIEAHTNFFAGVLHVKTKSVNAFVKTKDWGGLIAYLLTPAKSPVIGGR